MRFNETRSTLQNQMDFIPREQRNDIRRTAIAFSAMTLLVLLFAYTPLLRSIPGYAPIVMALLLAGLGLHVIYRKQANLDLVMATEYQNLLFSQVIALGCSFCLIVRRDGTITYANEGLATVFPGFSYAESKALEGIFELGGVRAADRERIMGAIHSGYGEHLIFPIFNQNNEKKDYIITVEALPRPSGFSIIRGREYLGKRSGAQMMPDILRSTSIDKIDRLLSTTPTAHYTTDAYGRFEYVNPAFELLFGYESGDILESKLSIHHLIFSLGNQVLTEESSLSDYGGNATIAHKRGTRSIHGIVQYTLRDAAGKIIGATGSIFPAAASA